MTLKIFKAFQVEEISENKYAGKIVSRAISDLPEGDVLVRVHYSSLNYKDALSASGNKGVTKLYPHTPGIDAAGVVVSSTHSAFQPGTEVIVSCYGLGMKTAGGFGEYIRVPAAWVMKCPQGISLKESMIYGTAGFTAALSVEKLLGNGVHPEQGRVLVTGATGGVGSVAVAILAQNGFSVSAVSGKSDQGSFLHKLGADRIISREKAIDPKNRALLKPQWAGVVDTVGGPILAASLKGTKYGGTVTCCGNVASPDLSLTVYPFILRAVSLIGIDAAECPMNVREKVWEKLADSWRINALNDLAQYITLEELAAHIDLMLHGKIKGRVVLCHQE